MEEEDLMEEFMKLWGKSGWTPIDQAIGDDLYAAVKEDRLTPQEAILKAGYIYWFSADQNQFDILVEVGDWGEWTSFGKPTDDTLNYAFKDQQAATLARLLIDA